MPLSNIAPYTCCARASRIGQITPSNSGTFIARASSASIPMQGLPAACESALTVDTPMRTPVNEPGPTTAPKRSISSIFIPVMASAASTIGISRWLCVMPTESSDS